jgi:hypothetical protein
LVLCERPSQPVHCFSFGPAQASLLAQGYYLLQVWFL